MDENKEPDKSNLDDKPLTFDEIKVDKEHQGELE